VVSLPWERSRTITDNIITRGWADPQNHSSLTESQPLVPGLFYDLTFDLQPDDQVIPEGQQIGLMVFSSDRDFTLWPDPGTQLTIDVETEGDGSILRARFGPHPHVWTLYVMLYSTSLAIFIGCVMFGISQWMVGSRPWGLYLSPAALILSGLVYGASYVGQGLGSLQMQELRSFVEKALWPRVGT
jgi:hypothetical protein